MALVSKNFSDIITFTRASTATYFDSAGVLQSAAIDAPRLDYNPSTLAAQGLLIEEARTNSIRNNTMQGAVAGTPGTLPTNWSEGLAGLTRQVVGTGTTNGITWVELRFSGTSTGTVVNIGMEGINTVAASVGQNWTNSFWVALVGGTITNVTGVNVRLRAYNSVPSFLGQADGAAITLTSSLVRYETTYSSLPATTAYIEPVLRMGVTNGAAIDITLRIGLPQLEQGAFATSVIPTTTTALTRSADVASVNTLSPWYNQTASSFYAEVNNQVLGTDKRTFWVTDATNTPAYGLRMASNNTFATAAFNSGTFSAIAPGTVTVGIMKQAGAITTNDVAAVANGGAVGTASSWTNFTADKLRIGSDQFGGNVLNGHIRRITYYPRKLSSAELQAITA
jgi:hypothetical protein